MLKNVDTGREFITTSQAANRSNLTTAYITYLLRKGTLEGFQLAREWFIYTDSLEKFLATPRKSGPKGHVRPPNNLLQTHPPQRQSEKRQPRPHNTQELDVNASLRDVPRLPL